MVHRLLSTIALTALILCVNCSESDSDSAMKPSRPGQITVTVQDDRQTALLSIAPLDDALRYVWFKDGARFETTEQPQCPVRENGIYKVAGENESGRGAFSDEVRVDFSEFGSDNLLTEEFIPDELFRKWLDEKLAGGSGFYSFADAAAYDGEFDINSETGISNIEGIRYFSALKRLRCSEITTLSTLEEILQLTGLEYLWITFSSCTEFDLTPLRNLEEAHIMANSACEPDGLKVAGLDKLRSLTCNSNNLETLDLTGCTALEELVCSYNSLSDDTLILPEGAPLSALSVHTNVELTRMELSRYASTLTFLNVGSTGFRELDLTGMTRLEDLSIENCGMSSSALTGLEDCTSLKSLRIDSNNFDKLDVSTLVNLEMLRCDFNRLTSMDLSHNGKILELSFQDNELAEITLSNLSQCWYMNLSQNALRRVDLTPCTALEQFFCNGNKLKKLENKVVEIKLSEEYDVERLNGDDFSSYCDEIGRYFYSYDDTGIFVHEFSDEE